MSSRLASSTDATFEAGDTSADTIAPLQPPSPFFRLYRSRSIQDQLSRTPAVTPAHWGHSPSRSYGGNDWPLPAADKTAPSRINPLSSASTSPRLTSTGQVMMEIDQLWPNSSAANNGNAPKKRGPKPKNEPAATVSPWRFALIMVQRRQQLNRIAQRAHRDRKELYIKNLEVKRFRHAYSAALTERQKLIEENRLLREEVAAFRAMSGLPADELLTQVPYSLPAPQSVLFPAPPPLIQSPPARPAPTVPSDSSPRGLSRVFSKLRRKESQAGLRISPPLQSLTEFENPEALLPLFQSGQQIYPPSPPHGSQSSESSPPQSGHGRTLSNATMSTLQSQGMEQPLAAVALQFIVRLEAVCLDHLHAAHQSDSDPEAAPHGHALMGSALSYVTPASTGATPANPANPPPSSAALSPTTTTTAMDQRTLEVLLNLNFQTNNGEYINTMGGQIHGTISVLDAWNLVSSHKKFGKFDLDVLANRLAPLVVCKGYGPVIEAEDVLRVIDEVSLGQTYRF